LQIRNIGYITTIDGTRYYNIQYYNANNEPIGKPVKVEASIIESKDFYDKNIMLAKQSDPLASSYRIIPSEEYTENQRNQNETALSLNVGDQVYYEIDMDNEWNSNVNNIRINPLSAQNVAIDIVVYQKDGVAVDKNTEGAVRKVVGILPSPTTTPSNVLQTNIALREILWNNKNAIVTTKVNNVTAHADYQMGNKREVTIEDLTLPALS